MFYKVWHQWAPEGSDQRSILTEVAWHMKNAWEYRATPGNTRFKAGLQLAHKGWKFGGGVVDLADGTGVPSIKGLRALIISGRYDWFERAAALAPGKAATAADAPSAQERAYLSNLCGPHTTLSRIKVDGAEVWMAPDSAGWRVAAVFVDDASASGLKATMQLAAATQGGCLGVLAGALIVAAIALAVAAVSLSPILL